MDLVGGKLFALMWMENSPRQSNRLIAHIDEFDRKTVELWDNFRGSGWMTMVHGVHIWLDVDQGSLLPISNVIFHFLQSRIQPLLIRD